MFDVLSFTLMSDEKVESEEEHEGELSMLKTPRRSRRKDYTSSTPTSVSNSAPVPTSTHASGSTKKIRSTKTKKRLFFLLIILM